MVKILSKESGKYNTLSQFIDDSAITRATPITLDADFIRCRR